MNYFSNVGIVGCKLKLLYCKISFRCIIMIWSITWGLKLHNISKIDHTHITIETFQLPSCLERVARLSEVGWKGCHETKWSCSFTCCRVSRECRAQSQALVVCKARQGSCSLIVTSHCVRSQAVAAASTVKQVSQHAKKSQSTKNILNISMISCFVKYDHYAFEIKEDL